VEIKTLAMKTSKQSLSPKLWRMERGACIENSRQHLRFLARCLIVLASRKIFCRIAGSPIIRRRRRRSEADEIRYLLCVNGMLVIDSLGIFS
jgi:hypothetical protein